MILGALLWTALWAGPAPAQDDQGQLPVLITADNITYDTERDTVTARGNVELTREEERLIADEITYNQALDRVTARGNIVLVGSDGDAMFADELDLDGALKDGFVEGVAILFEDNSRLAAVKATRREGNLTILQNAVYSPCEVCQESDRAPLWQIRANEVVHNREDRTITYYDATFEFLGVPIAYTPYFDHPDPTVDRKTGFLTPTFGTSSELGVTMLTPYFIDLGPSQDVTINPTFTSGAGILLGGEFRDLSNLGRDSRGVDRVASTIVSGNFTYTDAYASNPDESDQGQEFRGNFRSFGFYDLDHEFNAGFTVDLASDNSFLERYSLPRGNVLTNTAYVQRFREREAFDVSGYYFQSLLLNDPQGQIPIVLPEARYSNTLTPYRWGSRFTTETSALSLIRTDGLDTRRFSVEGGWELPFIGPIGDTYTLRTSLRGDVYNTEGDPSTFSSEGGNNTVGRVLPAVSLKWGWPLAGQTETWRHVIEPRVTLAWSNPSGNLNQIPNEDSLVFEFDESNLFEESRFPGIDRVEEGFHAAYGLEFSSEGPRALRISGVFGQNYSRETSPFPENSGLDKTFSDYVGRVDFRPSSFLNLSYRFRLARENLNFRRNDLNLSLGPRAFRANFNYIKLIEDLPGERVDEREQIIAGLQMQLTKKLAINIQTRRDLQSNQAISNSFGLIYNDPCLVLVMGLEKRFTTLGELEDETTFAIRIALKNLGSLETGTSN